MRRRLAPAAAARWAETAREVSAAIPSALIKQSVRFVTSAPAAGAVPGAVAALAEGVIRMMWLARLKPLIAVAAALVLATAGVAVQGRQQPAPEAAREQAKTAPPPVAAAVPEMEANRALARKQLILIDNALDLLHKLVQNSRVSFSDPRFALWERRRIETLRKAGAGKAEMVAALEKYINSLKQQEQIARTRHEGAQGTFVDVLEAQFRLMEAESWLNEEKAR